MALMHVNFGSNELQMETAIDAIVPRSCDRPCRVLYLLHGCSDDHTIWQRRTSIERYVEPLGLAVIMPQVARSFYTDMASGPRYWSYVGEELPALVQGWFPVSRRRQDTFVAGLSMGGYGAFKLAMRHPEKYAAAASMSGALDMVEWCAQKDPYLHKEVRWIFGNPGKLPGSEHDCFHLATRLTRKPRRDRPRFYQCCGTEDGFIETNRRFRDHAKARGLDLTYEEGPGNHSWEYWDRQIQSVLRWLNLPGAQARP